MVKRRVVVQWVGHPFVDGNGRTSRLLSTLCLYRTGYDSKRLSTVSEFYDRDRAAFYVDILGVRHTDMDLTGWLEFFASGLATQMQETVDRGRRVIKLDLLAQEHWLNDRQVAAIAHLRDCPPTRTRVPRYRAIEIALPWRYPSLPPTRLEDPC